MEIVYNSESLIYPGNNIENPSRLEGISRIGHLVNVPIDENILELVHSRRYIEKIKRTCKYKQQIAEIPTNKFTFEAALAAAATSLYAAKSGDFAAIRPPGHHASSETAAGFCLFNNMAIAAQSLVEEGKRVCIMDIDGHHGDGTERIFYKDNRVLFWSVYQSFKKCSLTSKDLIQLRRGEKEGKGFTYNCPMEEGDGDDKLLEETEALIRVIKDFNPDAIGISAGFDGHYKDPLLNLNFTRQGYHRFGELIGSLELKTFGVLEGGYHSDVVDCIEKLVSGINNRN